MTLLLGSFGDSIPENCTRVGILHAKGTRFTDEGGIYAKLRSEAGNLGANTVFVQNMEDASGAQVIAETLGDVQRIEPPMHWRCSVKAPSRAVNGDQGLDYEGAAWIRGVALLAGVTVWGCAPERDSVIQSGDLASRIEASLDALNAKTSFTPSTYRRGERSLFVLTNR